MKTKWHIYLIFILPILCIFLFISKADAQTWEWARRSRNGGANVDAYLTACDSKSNIYAAGFFNSSAISFGNTTIPYTLSNADDETFIVKYNSSGQVLWAKGILQGLNDPVSICTDPEGNLVLLGIFDAPRIKIDTFNLYNSLSAPGSSQYFIVKFAPGGNVIWAKTSGASSRFYAPSLRRSGGLFSYNRDCNTVLSWGAVATDNSDNIFVTGNYDAASNTIGSYTITNNVPSGDSDDVFVAKYDSSGNVIWVNNFGGTGFDDAFGISVSATGDVYICGAFTSPVCAFGASPIYDVYGSQIAFVAKYNASGVPLWASAFGGFIGANAAGIKCDGSGNVFVAGTFGDSNIVFGNTIIGKAYPGINNALFLFGISASNSLMWYKTISSPSYNINCFSIVLAACSQVWISGAWGPANNIFSIHGFSDSVNIDGHILYTPDSNVDPVFVAGYDLSGGLIGYSAVGAGGDDQSGIACDTSGNVYLCADYFFKNLVIGPDTLKDNSLDEYSYLAKFENKLSNRTIYGVSDTNICVGVLLQAPAGSTSPYLWNTGDTGSAIQVDTAGTFWVSHHGNCLLSNYIDTMHVSTYTISPGFKDTVVCMDQPFEILLNSNAPANASLVWSNGSSGTSINVSDTGLYWVSINNGGCPSSDTFYFSGEFCDCSCFVPAAFTPNNDGKNESIKPLIKNGCNIGDYTFSIFDRWGSLIFRSHDPSARWDGNYHGVPYEMGTYMYEVSYNGGKQNKNYFLKGDITLIR